MAQTLILARNIREANQYAKIVGLERFSYRAVRNAGAIRGIRHAEVHLLSSFLKRLDRHAIMAALRNARSLEVFYVDVADLDFSPAVVDQGDGMGEQLTIEDLTKSEPVEAVEPDAPLVSNALETQGEQIGTLHGTPVIEFPTPDEIAEHVPGWPRETEEDSETAETEPSEDPAPAAPKRRRRTRCKDCEELHFPEDACATKAPAPTPGPAGDPFANFF